MSEIPKQLIVYDGVCILCNRYIQYLLRIDRKAQFIFSTYQGLPAYIEKDTQQLAWIFPRVLRDSVYRSISKNRYRLFGKYDSCLLPNATFQDRFIG